ncbi:WD40 repeat-like protein [Suillus weaverae]|nr:WD40 repeat-like protein [Suillus weaverae]
MSSPAANMKKKSAVAPCKTMRGHTSPVFGVAPLPSGQRIITCSGDGSLRLWDLESGAQIGDKWRDGRDEAAVRTMALSSNGKTIASGSQDGTVRLWDVETGKVVIKWKGHTDLVMSVCWSPNGERVVSGGWDGTARVWDVKSGEPVEGLNPIKTGHRHVYAVSYSPEATMIATGGYYENGIDMWDAKTGRLLNIIKLDCDWPVWSLAWTSDEEKLIAGLGNGSIRIFDTATLDLITDLSEGHTRPVYSITLFPNDCLLASTSWDGTALLWDLDTNLQVGPPLQHEGPVECAAFSADGKLLSTACHDKNAYVWDIHAVLSAAGSEDLLSIPDNAPKVEPKQKLYASSSSSSIEHISPSNSSQDIENKSFLEADATRDFDHLGDAEELPPGFFDSAQANAHSSATPGAHPNLSALLGRFSSLLHCSPPNEAIESQQPPVHSESRSHVLLSRLSSFLRSPPNTGTDEISELPQPPILSRLHSQVLLAHLSSFLPRSQPHTDKATEPQQSQTPSGSRPGALIGRLSSLFRSPLDADEVIEVQHCPGPTTSSHCSPCVIEVAPMRDREVLFVARRPETVSEKAKRIKNPKPWVRVVLFLCCVSPGTDDAPRST